MGYLKAEIDTFAVGLLYDKGWRGHIEQPYSLPFPTYPVREIAVGLVGDGIRATTKIPQVSSTRPNN